jgi:phage-related protein
MATDLLKPLYWTGSAKKDLLAMPAAVVDVFGYALFLAQAGSKHPQAKPLRGFGGASVLEVVETRAGGSYRAVYWVKLGDAVYVLHCFQKKSTRGIKTPQRDIETVRSRLRASKIHAGEG